MINLLPPENIKKIKTLYRYRMAAIFFLLAGSLMWAVVILSIPSYIVLWSQNSAYKETSSEIEKEQADVSELVSTVTSANALSKEISLYQNQFSFSDITNSLRVIAGETVHIQTITYEKKPDEVKLLVSGLADNRAALTGFSKAVESDERFASAAIPIQNLAGDRDVAFTITVVLAQTI